MVDRKVVAAGIYAALARADVELRDRMPDLFAHVDELKARPGWEPFADQGPLGLHLTMPSYEVRECARCGDPFIAEPRSRNRPPVRCCSGRCAGEQRRFETRQRRRPRAA